MYLTTDVKSQLNGFLRGQNPSNTQTTTYTFIAPKDNGVVDLYYWVFCPYNLGKNVPIPFIGLVGDHVGDWERITIRTVNGVATQIDYHAHDDYGSGVIPWAQVPKFSPSSPNDPANPNCTDPNARPIAYIANGSHGFWSSVGTFTYVNAVVFKLQDQTSDGGVYWDTQNSLTTINYPDTYSGSLGWLNYLGDWGNKGQTNCWWHVFYSECELEDGPNGPVRADVEGATDLKVALKNSTVGSNLKSKMTAPLSQTLATISTDDSKYTVYLAAQPQWPVLAIKQQCATLNATSTDSTSPSPDDQYSYTSTYASLTPVQGTKQYTFTVPACDSPSFVSSYAIGDCTNDLNDSTTLESNLPNCSWGTLRNVRAFSDDPSVPGVQQVGAVVVNDLDNWSF